MDGNIQKPKAASSLSNARAILREVLECCGPPQLFPTASARQAHEKGNRSNASANQQLLSGCNSRQFKR